MNIGIVTTWFERGAAYVSKNYMELLESAGHTVFIYARGGGNDPSKTSQEWNKENVTRDEVYSNTKIKKRLFFSWIKENNLQAILFNEQREYNIVANTKLKFPHVKIGAYVDYYTEGSLKWFSFYDFLICNTHRHMEAMKDHQQKYYIRWGTNTDLFVPSDKESSRITFFHSVGMSNRKGTDILIDAFIEGKCFEKSDLIIHTQIPIEKVCKYSAEQLKKYNISVIKKTVTAPGLYHLGDVYVYPTRLDGLGLTMYEALSCGLPVITSDFPPMNEAVNEEIGKLVKISDYYCRNDAYYYPMVICDKNSLIAAMQWYIDNPDELKSQKTKAREYALNNYNLEDRSKDISDIFNNAKVFPYNKKLHSEYKKDNMRNFTPYVWFFEHKTIGKIVSKMKGHK